MTGLEQDMCGARDSYKTCYYISANISKKNKMQLPE